MDGCLFQKPEYCSRDFAHFFGTAILSMTGLLPIACGSGGIFQGSNPDAAAAFCGLFITPKPLLIAEVLYGFQTLNRPLIVFRVDLTA